MHGGINLTVLAGYKEARMFMRKSTVSLLRDSGTTRSLLFSMVLNNGHILHILLQEIYFKTIAFFPNYIKKNPIVNVWANPENPKGESKSPS